MLLRYVITINYVDLDNNFIPKQILEKIIVSFF